MDNKELIIVGAGGFASVVAETAILCGYRITGFVDDSQPKGTLIYQNLKVIFTIEELCSEKSNLNFIIAIGNNKVRERISTTLIKKHKPINLIHPNASVSSSVKLGSENIILSGAVINANVTIGNNNIINSQTLIDHDSKIANHIHIAQGSILGSNVIVKDGITTQLGQKINSFSKLQ